MFFKNRYSFVLLVFVFLIGCGNSQTQSTKNDQIKPHAVKQKIDKNEDVVIIDVRTPSEYVGPLGHIPGAKLHPVQEIEDWYKEFEKNKNDEIIMVCRSGNRSDVATKFFRKKGFDNVKNMIGGMRAWNKEGLPIKKDAPKEEANDEK